MRILLIFRFNMGEKGNLYFFSKASGLFLRKQNVSIFQWILCSSGKSYFRYNLPLNSIIKNLVSWVKIELLWDY